MKNYIFWVFCFFITFNPSKRILAQVDSNQEIERMKYEEFKDILIKRVNERIANFLEALKVLSLKSESFWIKNRHQRMASSFFVDGAKIEISKIDSNNKETIKELEAKDYLTNFRNLDYDSINLELDHINTGELKPLGDDSFEIDGLYGQVFQGYNSDLIQYEDYTLKNISIFVFPIENGNEKYWDIQFKSIKVVKTVRRKNEKR